MIAVWIIAIALFVSFGLVVFRGAPYVPSHRREVRRAFGELYPLSEKDTLVDIGSGDGVILREAARCGARAVGYELNPFLVVISRFLSRHDERVQVRLADAWLGAYPAETTVVYIFAVSRDLPKLITKLRAHVTMTGRPLALLCYGAQPEGVTAAKLLGAHGLYLISPLQGQEA